MGSGDKNRPMIGLELTRFSGHLTVRFRGVHDDEEDDPVHAGVQAADGAVGAIRKDGGVGFRGAVYYQTASAKWVRLNSVAAVYEHNVDAKGKAKSDLWEWK